jgi:hypothetical protein
MHPPTTPRCAREPDVARPSMRSRGTVPRRRLGRNLDSGGKHPFQAP